MSRQAIRRGASWAFAVNSGFSRAAQNHDDGRVRRKGAFVKRRDRPHGTPREADAGVAAVHGSRRCPDGPLRQFLRPPMVSRWGIFRRASGRPRIGPGSPGRLGRRAFGPVRGRHFGMGHAACSTPVENASSGYAVCDSRILKNNIPGETADDNKAVRSFARVGPARDVEFAASRSLRSRRCIEYSIAVQEASWPRRRRRGARTLSAREWRMAMDARIPVRLAAALLLKRGEISLGEIKALPMVYGKDFAIMIANILTTRFNAELH